MDKKIRHYTSTIPAYTSTVPVITIVGVDSDVSGEGSVDLSGTSKPTGIEGLLERLNNDECDLVAIGRALLVDAEWVNKMGEEKEDEMAPFTKETLMKLS